MNFGPYEVEKLLGRGAMGTVYLARDRRIGRRVALKTISLSPQQLDDSTSPDEFYTRLQREAEVVGSLVHPNIVALYEAGYEDGRISYLAMEYVEGKTLLEAMVETGAPLEPAGALRIIDDVLQGLAHAHARGIIHRDIKPANILITTGGVAKIADFGIARPQNSSITAAGSLLGTPNYMSPEQVLGQPLTPKADVFSTGVLLFEMLTAVKPFAGAGLTETLHHILRSEVPHASDANPAVPRAVGDVIGRMVAKEPERRPDAEHANRELRATGLAAAAPPSAKKQPHIALLSAAAVVIIAILGVLLASRRHEQTAVEIASAQFHELEAKRRELDRAEQAMQGGRYQEALDRYNAYLVKYPASNVAMEGRDRAKQALEPQPPADQARTPKRRRKRDEDISPSELLNRIRKVFKH